MVDDTLSRCSSTNCMMSTAANALVIDASRTVNLDPDVMEIIEDQQVRSKDRGVTIELVCNTDKAPKGTKLLTAGVIRAAKRLVRRK